MAANAFLKRNIVLIVGLTLPVLLMAGFMVASRLPQTLADPPRFDMVFSVPEYVTSVRRAPVGVRLVVRDQVLKAQYTKDPSPNGYGGWTTLYLYDAATQRVRELAFPYPPAAAQIDDTWEAVVESTADLRLDTTLQSPDGYVLTYQDRGGGGLLTDLFWGSRRSNEPRLRKGSASVALASDGSRIPPGAGVEFIGWVTGRAAGGG